MKHIWLPILAAAAALVLAGCSSEEAQLEAKAVDIVLEGESAVCEGAGVHIDGGQITITSHGIYRVSGTLADGQILVECTDSGEVWLILDGADITSTAGACIYIKQADLTHINLAAGSVNTLTDGVDYVFDEGDDEPDGTLFARDDLVLQGEGTLVIDASFRNAIAAKDDLTINGGIYDITSAGHGIKGKDTLTITGGAITIEAEGDGLKSTNAEGGTKGVISITGGVIDIHAGDEGMQAISDIAVSGGVITVDSENNGIRSGTALVMTGGELDIKAADNPLDAPKETKTGGVLVINGIAE